MKKENKKKIVWQQYIGIVLFTLVGALCGILMARYIESVSPSDMSMGQFFIRLGLLLLGMCLMLFLQIIIHEAGHLIFGLLSGYRFSSFRIGSLMWIRQNGSIRFKRLSIVGTAGQCLMSPPDMIHGRFPFILYNLGGAFTNIVSGLIFLGLYLLYKDIAYLPILFLLASIIGFAFALINGIPMRLGPVNNDGYNLLSLSKNPAALRPFWIQLKVNERAVQGILLKDMPDEWFDVSLDHGMKDSLTAAIGVFSASRLMEEHRFQEADEWMEKLLSMDTAIVGLHRSLMICDRIFCELIHGNHKEELDALLDKQQKRFMKQMKNFPSVIRTEYAYTLIAQQDDAKAKQMIKRFEKMALKYPYPMEIENERDLMQIADAYYQGSLKESL